MTIEKIELTEKRLKEKEREKEDRKEKEKYDELMKKFNSEAEKISCPYRVLIEYSCPHLYKISNQKFLFWKWRGTEKITQIVWINWLKEPGEDYFVFNDGLEVKTFGEIEQILNRIDLKFKIKLKGEKIPAKYTILNELEKQDDDQGI